MNILELTACAGYSAASYDDVPDSQKFENRWTSTTFYWLPTEEAHYLIFRGSQQPRDFLVDAMALPVRYLGTWVHGGFALAHFSVRKKLRKILGDIEKSGKPLVVTGHSLGAAQGSLTLLMAHRLYPSIDARGIFFGKPRVYKKPGRDLFPDKRVLSCVCGSDVVTRLPRYLFRCESEREQDMFYLGNDGNNYLNPDMEFVAEDFSVVDAVSDHSMNTYLQRLREIQ